MRLRLAGFLLAVTAYSAAGQWPPTPHNLKVLPTGISVDALIDTMKAFTRALGVRCTYCHVGREGDPIGSYDFASDAQVPKEKARAMLRMVTAINAQFLSAVPQRHDPAVQVNCSTCHHGVALPEPIQSVILARYRARGADSAVATYLALRARYYGSAAYDFGEVPLADVADALQQTGRLGDAVRLYRLNTELLPNSQFAHRQLGFAYLLIGDSVSALATFKRRLELVPDDDETKRLIDVLTKRPQR
jgi:tetratricopeptide (TPR) repeat protein